MLAKNARVYSYKKMSIILPMQRKKYAKRNPAEPVGAPGSERYEASVGVLLAFTHTSTSTRWKRCKTF